MTCLRLGVLLAALAATPASAGAQQPIEEQIAAGEAAIKAGGEAKAISAPVPGNLKSNRDASWLFNGRLSPVVPYAIRGAIWNQGYANSGAGLPYYNNLHSLVRGWRIVWDKPELPVYFHQFYSAGMKHLGKEVNKPSIDGTAEMRLGTCGRAAPYYDVELHDELDNPVPPGVPGEIVVRKRVPSAFFAS